MLRCKTIILLLCWVTCASLYYVLLLDQSELSVVNNQHLTLEQSSHLALSPDQGKYSLPGSLLGLLDHSGCAAPRLRLRHPYLGEADVRQEEVVEYLKFCVPPHHLCCSWSKPPIRSMCFFLLLSGACLTTPPLLPETFSNSRVALSVIGRCKKSQVQYHDVRK